MTPAGWTAEPWKLNKWGNVYSGKNIDNALTVNGMALTSSLTKEAVANTQRIIACVNGCAGLNPGAYRECVEALQAQHKAIDWLLAQLIEAKSNFYPSKSPVWPLLLQGNAAIEHAQAHV